MKFALLTTIACNMAVAYAAEGDHVGVRGFIDQLFGANQLQYVTTDKEGQPDYCYEDTEEADCYLYKNGYPKCCTKEKGNCPVNNKPSSDGCSGSCNPGNDEGDDCYDGYSNERPNEDNDGNRIIDRDCDRNSECRSYEYCSKRDGQCNSEGVCVELGDDDGRNSGVDPVCGCDGNSYENPEAADYAGVSIDQYGCCDNDDRHDFCDDGNRIIDRDCVRNSDCSTGSPDWEYCRKSEGDRECGTEFEGVCIERGDDDGEDDREDPVCGCDRNSYRNPTAAHYDGVSVDYFGCCDNDDDHDFCDSGNGSGGPTCRDDSDCNENDEYCGQLQFERCGRATGVCLYWPRESECSSEGTYWVCGCDNKSYRNECYAAAASVSVNYSGRC